MRLNGVSYRRTAQTCKGVVFHMMIERSFLECANKAKDGVLCDALAAGSGLQDATLDSDGALFDAAMSTLQDEQKRDGWRVSDSFTEGDDFTVMFASPSYPGVIRAVSSHAPPLKEIDASGAVPEPVYTPTSGIVQDIAGFVDYTKATKAMKGSASLWKLRVLTSALGLCN